MRLFSYDDLLQTETLVLEHTHDTTYGWVEMLRAAADTLLKMPHYLGKLEPVTTPIGTFQSQAWLGYLQAPVTARAGLVLVERGFYQEALMVTRGLIELFVQLRYFHRYPEKMEPHIMSGGGKGRVPFRTMMDEFSAGYYDPWYKSLSQYTHSTLPGVWRAEYTSPTEGRVIQGLEFNDHQLTYCTNNTVPVLRGFLMFAPVFFPDSTLESDPAIADPWRNAIYILTKSITQHKAMKPEAWRFYDYAEPLFSPETQP